MLDAHRLGIFQENPLEGVKPPQYDPARAVIPSVAQLREVRTADDDVFRLILQCGFVIYPVGSSAARRR